MASLECSNLDIPIKFGRDLLKKPPEKIKMIQNTIIHISVKRALMFKWHKQYLEGRDSTEDDVRHGQTRLVTLKKR